MKNLFKLLFLVVFISQNNTVYSQCSAACETLILDYSTGIDNNGIQIPIGSADDDWIVDSDPTHPSNFPINYSTINAISFCETYPTPSTIPPNWNNLTDNNWITTQSAFQQNSEPQTPPDGTSIHFKYEFEVCAAGNFNFSGFFHADRRGIVYLDNFNGTSVITNIQSNIISYNRNFYLDTGKHYLYILLTNKSGYANELSTNLDGRITSLDVGSLKKKECFEQKTSLFGKIFSDDDNNSSFSSGDGNAGPYLLTNSIVKINQIGGPYSATSQVNNFGYYNFIDIPYGNYEIDITDCLSPTTPHFAPVISTNGKKQISLFSSFLPHQEDFLVKYIDDNCAGWRIHDIYEKPHTGPLIFIETINCGGSLENALEEGKTYVFRFRYLCTDGSVPNYQCNYVYSPSFMGSIFASNLYEIEFKPNSSYSGLNTLSVYGICDGDNCNICTFNFNVISGSSEYITSSINTVSPSNEKLSLYPNPTDNGITTLNYESSNKSDISIVIFNTVGKIIYNSDFVKNKGLFLKEIDLSGNSPGVYFINIIENNNKITKKIIIH